MKNVILLCLFFRLLSIIVVRTYFVADEFWQSLEIAHGTFGYGYRTWEFREKIRCFAYPAIYVFYYKVLYLLRVDNVWNVVVGPRIVQACLTAITDVKFLKLCNSLGMPRKNTYLFIFFDWFLFYCGSRTLINVFEYNIIVFALSAFPWSWCYRNASYGNFNVFTCVVVVNCFVRPTACLVWLPFCSMVLLHLQWKLKVALLLSFITMGLPVLTVLTAFDSYMYGELTFTPWNFLYFNVIRSISGFYGTHPFHWYFTQGVPVVMGVFTIPLVLELLRIPIAALQKAESESKIQTKIANLFATTVLFALVGFSFLSHKEFRFILSILPMMKILGLQQWDRVRASKFARLMKHMVVMGFLVPVLIFGLIHQRGTLPAMQKLAEDAHAKPNGTSLLILTPCHATPLYSHLHINIPVRFITCEPPISDQHSDESEVFFADPLRWTEKYWGNPSNVTPTHVLLFTNLAGILNSFLENKQYQQLESYFHTPFSEGRVGSSVLIYRSKMWDHQ